MIVFNKCDRLDDDVKASEAKDGPRRFYISALDRRSTRPLMEAIEREIWGPRPDASSAAVEADGVGEEVRDESPDDSQREEE